MPPRNNTAAAAAATQTAATEMLEARVLCHVVQANAPADSLLIAPKAVIESLAKAGDVDPHPDAVAYAKEHGAPVIEYDPNAKAEEAGGEEEQPAE